jgi:hypothetical protein
MRARASGQGDMSGQTLPHGAGLTSAVMTSGDYPPMGCTASHRGPLRTVRLVRAATLGSGSERSIARIVRIAARARRLELRQIVRP